MRILIVSQHYDPSGFGYAHQCMAAARGLATRRHEVCVVTSSPRGRHVDLGVTVHGVLTRREVMRYQTPRLAQVASYLRDERLFRRNGAAASAVARAFDPDVVFFWQFWELGLHVVQRLGMLGLPLVFNVGDVFLAEVARLLRDDASPVWRVMRSVLYRRFAGEITAARLILCSNGLRERYRRDGFDPRRMTVIRNALASREVVARPPTPGSGRRLLFAGRLHPDKGVDVAIRAVAMLNADGAGEFTLDVIGSGEASYVDELHALSRRLRQEDAVRFAGGCDRATLMTLYGDYDMLLVPSTCEEGGPLVAIEALAHGVPVVGTQRGGITDAVSDGVEGLLVAPGDAPALAGAIGRLADDETLRRGMSHRAIEKVRRCFLLEDHVTATEALLARVASGDDVPHDASPGTSGVRGLKSPRRALASLAYWAGHVGDYITTPGRREWSIGVYAGSGPFALQPCADVVNPVLTADDVTDRRATFVADPFMIRVDDVWHMFFEVMDARTRRGVIGLATSDDARRWTYRRTVLAEGFHLSYPHVLRWQGEFFMVPETRNRAGVLLYRARRFPDRWEPVATLLAGDYVDATPFRHDGRWWMPVARGCVSLHLFSADALTGPWVEHPRSPIVEGNPRAARPAGPVVAVGARRFRLAQQDFPGYGRGVRIYEMLRLSASDYSERAVADAPLIGPTGRGWNGHGMHHADVHRLDDGTWIACVDGCRSDGRPPRDQSAKGMSGSQFPVVRSAV